MGYIKKIETNYPNCPITCLSIMNRKLNSPNKSNLLIVGNYIGKIDIYNLNEYNKVASINSHLKMITALDSNSNYNQIVSGSEDTYLNVWNY